MNKVKLTKGELTKIILEEVRSLNEQPADPAAANVARKFFEDLLRGPDAQLVSAYTIISATTRKN
jgi:hypothetical protein